VRWPYEVFMAGAPVEQVDGAIHLGFLPCIVECKDTAQPVAIEAIAKLRNQLLRRPSAVVGLVFSRSGFTDPALMLAQFLAPQTILLWSGEEIAYFLEEQDFSSALLQKYRSVVETGIAEYDVHREVLQ
jgi:hypothetical protein